MARIKLGGGIASIDRDRCAGDELGLVAGQEGDQVGDPWASPNPRIKLDKYTSDVRHLESRIKSPIGIA